MYKTNATNMPPALREFRDRVFEKLIKNIDLDAATKAPVDVLLREVEQFIASFTEESRAHLNFKEQRVIASEIVNDMVGLGPLEPLMSDPDVTDIMINSADSIYVECRGKLLETDIKFRNEKHLMQVAQRIASRVGRRVDEGSPMVDARLKDGSRVNIIIPPIALNGVSISIRRFSKQSITLDNMVANGNMSDKIRDFLEICSKSRLNVLFCGGTGTGKTTMLNAMSQMIDPTERIVTIEDSAELKLQQPHVIRLESRPENIEGEGRITIQDLLRNSLRMRPDRIVVGECRGAESFDMLQAMNTGHDGSMSTLHANSANEAVSRLQNMVLMSGHELPSQVIKSYIADAVDLIVHVSRMRDGIRRISEVADVYGVDEKGEVIVRSVFKFKYLGEDEEGYIKGAYDCNINDLSFESKIIYHNLDKELKKLVA